MICAALQGKLDDVNYTQHPVFGMLIPDNCPGVPSKILDPRSTWQDTAAYDAKSRGLALQFLQNFEKYATGVSEEILQAAPRI